MSVVLENAGDVIANTVQVPQNVEVPVPESVKRARKKAGKNYGTYSLSSILEGVVDSADRPGWVTKKGGKGGFINLVRDKENVVFEIAAKPSKHCKGCSFSLEISEESKEQITELCKRVMGDVPNTSFDALSSYFGLTYMSAFVQNEELQEKLDTHIKELKAEKEKEKDQRKEEKWLMMKVSAVFRVVDDAGEQKRSVSFNIV